MKSDHRHELKTNELAEWLSNLPQLTKKYLITIIWVLALIVVAAAFFIWRSYSKSMDVREQVEFTNLLNQLSGSKMQILQAQSQGADYSFYLRQLAQNLETFAQNTNDNNMAALAFIKRAEALRAELHYGAIGQQYITEQVNQAKASYTEAINRASFNPSLMSAAKFGLGLCEEELGNFEQAQQIYQDIAVNPVFEGTVAVVQAQYRLETISDYKQKLVFKPAPEPAVLPDSAIKIESIDANLPAGLEGIERADANLFVDFSLIPQIPDNIPQTSEVNLLPQPGKGDSRTTGTSVSKDSEVNVPGE